MTKVTIDRELLEQVASEFEHDNDRYMLGRELRKVLDTPRQPEGDGLEVAGYTAQQDLDWQGDCTMRKTAMLDYDEPLCRLSDAQAIIDGLRGEVGAQRVKTCIALKERNHAREERDAALAECERLRMQLAACGVVALANTIESAGDARQMHPDYMSASCSDVADAVDREIALRTERDQLAGFLREVRGWIEQSAKVYRHNSTSVMLHLIDSALSAGKDSDQ